MTEPAPTPAVTDVDQLAEWVRMYRYARSMVASWQEQADAARHKITTHLTEHDAEIGLVDGAPAVKHTPVTTRRVDTKALRHDHPQLAEQYMTTRTSYRFTVVDE